MEDTSNTPGNLRQERKCSTSLETKIAGFARDEVPIGRMTSIKKCFSILLSRESEDSRTFSEKAAIKHQEQVVKN